MGTLITLRGGWTGRDRGGVVAPVVWSAWWTVVEVVSGRAWSVVDWDSLNTARRELLA